MSRIKINRVAALHATLEPSSIYIVKKPNETDAVIYLTGNDASVVSHTLTRADVQSMIDSSAPSQGSTGGSGSIAGEISNLTSRYEIVSSAGYRVHCLSSSTVYQGLQWSRVGTDLTINHPSHGRSIGDRVIVKNANSAYLNALITNKTNDSYVVTCSDSGASSGLNANYTNGFKFSHNSLVSGSLSSGTLFAPANCDIQLHSLRIHTPANSRAGTTYDLTLPLSVFLPAGADTSADDVYVPLTQVRSDADTMTVVGNTIAMNQAGAGYASFRIGALGSSAQGQLMLLQF